MSENKKTLTCFIYFAVMLMIVVSVETSESKTGSDVLNMSEKTVYVEKEEQKSVEAWVDEEKALFEDIETMTLRLKQIKWQRDKTNAYRDTMEKKLEELNLQEKEMKTLGEDLLRLLDASLDRLKESLEKDIPFNNEARAESIKLAKNILNDYDANLLGKTRAVFDALAAETDIGYTVESREGDIETESGLKRVTLLRIGRVEMYALTADREKAYQWNEEEKTWVLLKKGVRSLEEALDMVQGIRLVGLKRLSVKKPEKGGTPVEKN